MINKTMITTAMLAMSMAVGAQSLKTSPRSEALQLEALGMSANHRYVVGLNVATYRGFVWDTQTDNVVENDGDYANCDFRTVTNDGVAIGILGMDDMVTTNAAKFSQDGTITVIEEAMSQAYNATPDGSLIVGCLLNEMWTPTACCWKDGKRIMLPIPTTAEAGISFDGANAQFVSADGKIIVGYLQDWMSSRPAIVWRQQADGTYKYDFVAKDLWESRYGGGKTYLRFQPLGISANGRWLCLAAQKEAGESLPTPEMMVRMNLETYEVTEMGTPSTGYFTPETDYIYPSAIADDGTCVGTARDEMGFNRGVIWRADKPSVELLATVYPTIAQFEDYDGFMHSAISISADAKYIAGFACPVVEDGVNVDYEFESYLLSIDGTDGIRGVSNDNDDDDDNDDDNDDYGRRIFNIAGQPVSSSYKGIVITRDGKNIQ